MIVNNEQVKPFVLYVDDDEEDRLLFTDAMELVAPHFETKTIGDGVVALDYIAGNKDKLPCLFIVDLNMPVMNGKELISILKNDPSLENLPIVAFTTSSNPLDKSECAKHGVDMITKPITFGELKETVKVLLSYCNQA